jgi:multimeric flavodoxin WrbA
MKVITILGSPRKNGNTARVLEWIEEELKARGHEADRVNLGTHDINGCIACYTCQMDPEFNGCAVKNDDANEVLDDMRSADAVVFSSPLYMWNFSAQMKALMDRSLCLVKGYTAGKHQSVLEGKPASLLVTCAGPVEQNSELIAAVWDRFSGFLKVKRTGDLTVPFTTTPDELSDGVREQVKELVAKLTG